VNRARAASAAAVGAALFLAGTSLLQAASTPAPVRIQVVAREYSFVLSRLRVKAGPAIVELVNDGQDAHDLRLQRHGALHIAGIGTVPAGGHADLSLRLLPGRYSLWCSLANHRALGMSATLVVTVR
jgi:plastocyanin